MDIQARKEQLRAGTLDPELKKIYVTDEAVAAQRLRYEKALDAFAALYDGARDVTVLSAPGRTEVCGNHTDHNHGKVLAAAVNLDAIAVAAPNGENVIRVKSEGFDMDMISLDELEPNCQEYGKSVSLLRGMCARLKELGYQVGGFDAYTTSQVFSGSGLSSSAAYEVLLGTIFSALFNDCSLDAVTNAQVAQFAENHFFGKPCGLLDQMTSSVGGFVTIDFYNPEKPVIEKVPFDFASCGHALCILDTGGDHADLTEDYAAVRSEMEAVAHEMGQNVLADVAYDDFAAAIPQLRKSVGDRAILRAIHFFCENKRVEQAVAALNQNDFDTFRDAVLRSGQSSFMYNQNVFTPKAIREQGVSLALAMTQQILGDRGAYRVHGGGFAGTMQAFVPLDLLETYQAQMEAILGKGSCYVLSVRPVGGVKVF